MIMPTVIYVRGFLIFLPTLIFSRINFLESAILSLASILLEDIENQGIVKNIVPNVSLIDSLTIMLCKGKGTGKVATELSDKSFCASKNMFYFGVKLHMVAKKVEKKLPLPNFVSITQASENDLTAVRPILP
jgi:hypothetical protein